MLEAWDTLALNALAASYFDRVDRPDGLSPADLFVEDGRLELGTLRLEGRAAIACFFSERERMHAENGRKTRHFFSGLNIEPRGDDRAVGRLAMLVYAGHGELPLERMDVATIGDFDDIYVRTADGWRFEARKALIMHAGPSAASFAKA